MTVDKPKKPPTRRAIFIRTIPGIRRSVLDQMVVDAKADVVYDYDKSGPIEVERFVKDARAGDTLLMASALCLILAPKDRPERYKPATALCAKLGEALAIGVHLIDIKGQGNGSISSAKPGEWGAHLAWLGAKASQGERKKQAKRKQAARAPAGIRARWLASTMAERLEAAKIIWTSGRLTAEQARAKLPPDLREAGERTLYGILGPRRPNDPAAGGRGKTRGSR